MRSTTELDSATLALLVFGAAASLAALLFPTSVVVSGGGELNNTLGMGVQMEVVLGDGLDWETWNSEKVGNGVALLAST